MSCIISQFQEICYNHVNWPVQTTEGEKRIRKGRKLKQTERKLDVPKKKRMKESSLEKEKKRLKGDGDILAKKEKDLTECQNVAAELLSKGNILLTRAIKEKQFTDAAVAQGMLDAAKSKMKHVQTNVEDRSEKSQGSREQEEKTNGQISGVKHPQTVISYLP